jgi:Holliday junction resolvase RusA-like endonuclease
MKTVYELFVSGVPKAQPRPRMTAGCHVFNPHTADAWKEEIKAAFFPRMKETIAEPVCLNVCFYLPMPKGMKEPESGCGCGSECECGSECGCLRHAGKPDLDNLLKAVMDALTSIGVWKDDALVFKVVSEKWHSPAETGARIIIEA